MASSKRKQQRPSGPLFGFGTSGYLETPSVDPIDEDSVSKRSLFGQTRSALSLIPADGGNCIFQPSPASDYTSNDRVSVSRSSRSSSATMKSLMGGYQNKRHVQKMNLLAKLGGANVVKKKIKRQGGNGERTSKIKGLFEPNAIELCEGQSTTIKPISTECNLLLNEQWPSVFAPFQFVYVLSWNGVIYGGLNRDNQLWIFSEPIPFPSFGLPQNTIIPLSDSFDPNELFQIVSGAVSLPVGWNRLPPWSNVQGLQELLFAWWRRLTNECIGPICAFNHALDPFTGHCLSKKMSLYPVSNSNFEFLKGKRPSNKLVLDDATKAQFKWQRLDHLLLYERISVSQTPELELVGVVERPSLHQQTATVRLFPYGIPVGHAYELNIEAFGLPEPYLGILLEHLRSPERNSQITVSVLDKKEANIILLQMQQQMGDFLVLPSTCLFESSLERPGVYMVKESTCHVMNNNLLYDYKGDAKDGIEAKQVTNSERPHMFVAYLAERDARHPDRVNVLAGFNSQMQLILPEYDLSIPIDLARKIPSPPVEFSALMAPFVYDALTEETIKRLNQLDFVKTLNMRTGRSNELVYTVKDILKLLGGSASQICFNPPTGKYCVSGKCLRDYEYQSVLQSPHLLVATRNNHNYWMSLEFVRDDQAKAKKDKAMNRFQRKIEMIQQLSGLKLVPRYVDSWICNCASKCFMKKGKQKESIQTVMVIVYKPFGIPLRNFTRQFATVDDLSELNQQIIAHHQKIHQNGISLRYIGLDRIFIRPISKQIRFLPNRYKHVLDVRQPLADKVFFQLTKNDLEQNFKEHYKFIQGPITLTEHYDSKRDLRVYIFGDVHRNFNKKCPNSISIEHYLRQVVRFNTDKVIDIFLEAPFQDRNEPTSQRLERLKWGEGFLFDNVRKNWLECLFSDKVLCNEPNLRLHYTDVRAYVQSLSAIDKSIHVLTRYYFKKHSPDRIAKLHRELNAVVTYFQHLKQEYPDGVNTDDLLANLKINKQLNAIVDDTQGVKILKRELITKGVNQYVDSVDFDKMDKILKKLRKNKTVSDWNKSKSTVKKLKDIGQLLLYLMDIYTMARLFRSYTNKKSNSDRYAERAKYAVMYAGDHHARNYRNVLKKLGFKQVKQATAEQTQCLNVAKFHQPFFTQS